MLAKSPGFAAIAIAVLSLGIGANTAVVSLVNMLLLRPLPGVSDGPPVLGLYNKDTRRPDQYRGFSYPDFVDIRSSVRAFSGVVAQEMVFAGVTEGDLTRRVFVMMVSSDFFDVLHARPVMGRVFTSAEEQPGAAAAVAVVSHTYWRAHGSDPRIIGRHVTLNGRPFAVVGVAAPRFTGTTSTMAPEFWTPLGATTLLKGDGPKSAQVTVGARSTHSLLLVARLAAGTQARSAEGELVSIGARLASAYPADNAHYTIVSAPMPRTGLSTEPGDDRGLYSLSLVLLGLASSVLVIACLNLANMLLARGVTRRREMAIRASVGASRPALIRQLLVEGFVLASAGGLLGIGLAYVATAGLVHSFSRVLPMSIALDPSPDWRVVAGMLVSAGLATLAFALGPAWRVSRSDLVRDLSERDTGMPAGRGRRLTLRRVLLGSQMALSLALLAGGALFVRGAINASQATPGYSYDRGLLAEVDPTLCGYDTTRSGDVHRSVLGRLRELPGVESVSIASVVPFGDTSNGARVRRLSGAVAGAGPADPVSALYTVIGSDYFRTLGLRLQRGREFSALEADGLKARQVAIIDEPLARRLFPEPGADPVGQLITLGGGEVSAAGTGSAAPPDALEIVGVAPGLRRWLFNKEPVSHVYVPFAGREPASLFYHVRIRPGGPTAPAALASVRQAIRAVDPVVPVLRLTTLEGFGANSIFLWLFHAAAYIFTALGLSGLVLALVGTYGLNRYLVERRTREIGIRMALGATAAQVVRQVIHESFTVVVVSLLIGLALAVALGRVLSAMLYEVSATDPLTLTLAPLLLGITALVATYLPARRATLISPVTALRRDE